MFGLWKWEVLKVSGGRKQRDNVVSRGIPGVYDDDGNHYIWLTRVFPGEQS